MRGRTPKAKAERSRRDREIVALALGNMPPAAIADCYPGVSSHNIARILNLARNDGLPVPRFNSSGVPLADPPHEARGFATVNVPLDVLDQLRPAAAVRGITTTRLARRLIEALVRSDLVDAVLDDGARSRR